MRVPDELLAAVVFLCVELKNQVTKYHFCGTAFFLSIRNEGDPKLRCVNLVTAKHVIEKAKELGSDLYARINKYDGGADFVKLSTDWIYPDKEGSDIAVMAFAPPGEPMDILGIHRPGDVYEWDHIRGEMALDEATKLQHQVGNGDNVIVVGLFSQRQGKRRNIPIIRTGNIAAIPGEPLIDEDSGAEYKAYLIEARSTGGLSGSPVFAFLEPDYSKPIIPVGHQPWEPPWATMKPLGGRAGKIYLLGMIRGHWDIKKRRSNEEDYFSNEELESVNMGIAIVTPIEEVMELIRSEAKSFKLNGVPDGI